MLLNLLMHSTRFKELAQAKRIKKVKTFRSEAVRLDK